MTERKHLYLVTEHEESDQVGLVIWTEKKRVKPEKNEEAAIYVYDEEAGTFEERGKEVGMGYVDLPEGADNDEIVEAMKRKLGEIDQSWVEKAGLDPEVVIA